MEGQLLRGLTKRSREKANDPFAEQVPVVQSGMDFDYYRTLTRLSNATDEELARHYLTTGAAEGKDPAPWFSNEYYIHSNSDVRETGTNPFYHYLVWGKAEGRSPSENMPDGPATYDAEQRLVAQQFDRDFYLDQVDPTRTKNIDPVKHYCAFGWRQHFDPSPIFSTSYYLEKNPDVARLEVNPYLHFLTSGSLEGRPRARSNRAPKATRPEAADKSLPRAGVVAMVKNEGDIIEFFASHLLKLFDEIVFVDHQSQDATKDILQDLSKTYANVHLYRLEEPGYIQDIVSNHLIRDCEPLKTVDWVMFLDADEFLPFSEKRIFRQFLKNQEDYPIINFRWRNLIPATYWNYKVSSFDDKLFYVPEEPSPYAKVAFQPKKMGGQDYWINQGNHSISRAKGMDPLPAWETGATLFHLPIRSTSQLAIKLNQGVLSYLRRRIGSKDQVEGEHWFDILEKLNKDGEISQELLNGVVRDYGDLQGHVAAVDHAGLEVAGYVKRNILVGVSDGVVSPAETTQENEKIAELMFRLGGAFASDEIDQSARKITQIRTGPNNRLMAVKEASQFAYGALPARPEDDAAKLAAKFATPAQAIATLQMDSYLEIRNLTPTAWAGHLPFMFTLASVIKPRRFVELGTHHGASFLAYCQASQRAMSETQAVAVDCWEGDEQAGFYDNQVFDRFKYLIQPYDSFARYIRGFFDDAVHQFEDGSIDLLHIDGLHTYSAVKNDFETWLPKMSKDGLMIFHDINVHERDFGVWHLWKELSAQYPSAQFMHSHGLGVLYVGSEEVSGVRSMVEAMGEPVVASVLQAHFESVSQLSVKLATLQFELTQKEAQLQNLSVREELLTKAQQRSSALEEENRTLRDELRSAHARKGEDS